MNTIAAIALIPVVHLRDGSRLEAQSISLSSAGVEIVLGEQSTQLGWHRVRAIEGQSLDDEALRWQAIGASIWRGLSRLDRGDVVGAAMPASLGIANTVEGAGRTQAAAAAYLLRLELARGNRPSAMRAWNRFINASFEAGFPEAISLPTNDPAYGTIAALPPVWMTAQEAELSQADLVGDAPVLQWYAFFAARQSGKAVARPAELDGTLGRLFSAAADALSDDLSVREIGRASLRDQVVGVEESWITQWASLLLAKSHEYERNSGSRQDAMRAMLWFLRVEASADSIAPNLSVLALASAYHIAMSVDLSDTAEVLRSELESQYREHPTVLRAINAGRDTQGTE